MGEVKLSYYTVEDYLAHERTAEHKSEYVDGVLRSMSGGTLNHSLLSANMVRQLGNNIEKNKLACTVFNSDARVYIEYANSFVYPDVSIMCGELEVSAHDPNSYVNPILIVEVLSESTERYDRGEKFRKYRSLPAFKEYVLVDQYQPVVEVFYRENWDYWKIVTFIGLDKTVYINTLDFSIPMADIYRDARNIPANVAY